jgi:hypothetical protein
MYSYNLSHLRSAIGGTGLYDSNFFKYSKRVKVDTPYGETSDLVTRMEQPILQVPVSTVSERGLLGITVSNTTNDGQGLNHILC